MGFLLILRGLKEVRGEEGSRCWKFCLKWKVRISVRE